jgi:hypothetical protein
VSSGRVLVEPAGGWGAVGVSSLTGHLGGENGG